MKSKFKRYTGTDFVQKLFIKQKLAVSLFSIPLVYHKGLLLQDKKKKGIVIVGKGNSKYHSSLTGFDFMQYDCYTNLLL